MSYKSYEKLNLWVYENIFAKASGHRPVFDRIRDIMNNYKKEFPEEYKQACAYLGHESLSLYSWEGLALCSKDGIPDCLGLIAVQVYAYRTLGERQTLEALCRELGIDENRLQMKFKGRQDLDKKEFYDQDKIYHECFFPWCRKNGITIHSPSKREGPGRNVQYIAEVRTSCRTTRSLPSLHSSASSVQNSRHSSSETERSPDFSCLWLEDKKREMPRDFRRGMDDCDISELPMPYGYACFFQEDPSYPMDWTLVRERNLKLGIEKMLLIWRRSDSGGRIAAALQSNGVANVFSRGDYSWALIPQDKQRSLGIFQVGSGVDFRLCGGLKLGRRQWMLGAGPRIDCFGEEGSHRFRYRRVGGEDFKYLNGAHGLVNISELGEFEIWAEGACYNEIRKLEIVEPPFRGNNFREKLGWDVTALRKVGKVYGLDFSKLPVESLKENSSFADAAATAETSRTVVSLKENSSFADWLDTAYGEIFTNRFFNQKLINNNLTKRKIHE